MDILFVSKYFVVVASMIMMLAALRQVLINLQQWDF